MKVSVRLYEIKDRLEGNTRLFIAEDAAMVGDFLKTYLDPTEAFSYVGYMIDSLVKALVSGNPTCDFESYLGISVVPFYVTKEF